MPNVFAVVKGETSLFDKVAPFLNSAEQWLITNFCSLKTFNVICGYTDDNPTKVTAQRIAVCEALCNAVFLAMRHAIDDMDARNECMETMRELFRQLMSRLTLERVRIEQNCIYIDPRISFNEIDRFFFSGCACAYFQIAVDVYTDLRVDYSEWIDLRSQYDFWLLDYDQDKRIATTQFVYNNLKLGLKESKAFVEAVPSKIVLDWSLEEIDALREAIKAIDYATFKIVSHEQ